MWVRIPYFQKIVINCPYSYISNHYNLLVSKKHQSKVIVFTKTTFNLVKTLYRSGAITSFIILNSSCNQKKTLIKFTVLFYKSSPFFKNIKLISTRSKQLFITKKALLLTQKVFKSSLIIISSSKGLLTHHEATKLGVGGKIVYIIN